MRILYTLDAILEKEDFVLLDTSVINMGCISDDDIGTVFRNSPSFKSLSIGFLKQNLRGFSDFYALLINNRGNLHAVSEVYEEFQNLTRIFALADNHFCRRDAWKARDKDWRHEEYPDIPCIQEELFKELYGVMLNTWRELGRIVYYPKYSKLYDIFVKSICLLEDYGNLKSVDDFSNPSTRADSVDLRTDEKVIAAALYQSVVEKTPAAIVCRDKHFIKLCTGCRQLFAKNIPFCNHLLEHLSANPVTMYYYRDGTFVGEAFSVLMGDVPDRFNLVADSDKNFKAKSAISDVLCGLRDYFFQGVANQ